MTGRDDGERERKRRLAAVFGDVLPEQTSDDAPASPSSDAAGSPERDRDDQWWRDQVPPHHD